MAKRTRLRNIRPKAFLGADGCAMAIATLAAAGINASATASAAKNKQKQLQLLLKLMQTLFKNLTS